MRGIEDTLGKVLSAKKLARYLGVDERTVRQYYRELGGVRLGRRYLFFEKGVIDAIQKRTKMGGPSEETGYEKGESFFNKKGGDRMGDSAKKTNTRRLAKKDKHGLLT